MARPIVYDVTHLVFRMAAKAMTGIDRIDLAYGRHFATVTSERVLGAFCALREPHVMTAATLDQIVRQVQRASWEDADIATDASFARVRNWLYGKHLARERRQLVTPRLGTRNEVAARLWRLRSRARRAQRAIPRDAIYLNIAEHWLEYHHYFDWIGIRPDVQAVFFVHDLLPFDYPEYFRPGYEAVFRRRFETIAKHGTAFIVSTNVVRDRLREALTDWRKADAPIHVAPLPSPLNLGDAKTAAAELPEHPYFVLVSTVEPRKNHLLVLNVWRDLAALLGDATPRLVLVGSRGWENEQVIDMLDRCDAVTKHVLRTSRISRHGLTWLIKHAQALLMPSFDEGYGLPLVEALSLRTPVIASDIPTFREVTRGCALLLSPIDGVAWREAVMSYARRAAPAWQLAKAKTRPFRAPDWEGYFRRLDAFLTGLP
ncbi:MAG TPA: glycosyltransferase family 1 protein [Stellaceae bacterium]|nr:glycosyltransferase family 1 protein [Stellaceae bacterium]